MKHTNSNLTRSQKVLLVIGSLFAVGSVDSVAQRQNYNPPRPMLDFRCPKYQLPPTDSVEMFGEVLGVKELLGKDWSEQIKYDWHASYGKIVSGLGTPRIVWSRAEDQALSELMITLNVKGALPDISSPSSCVLKFEPSCTEDRVASYSDSADEQKALDKAAAGVKMSSNESVLYVLAYAGRQSCIWEAEWRAKRAKRYLIEKHNVDDQRIIVVDGGYQDNPVVELIVMSTRACGPLPKPTLLTSEAHVKGQCSSL